MYTLVFFFVTHILYMQTQGSKGEIKPTHRGWVLGLPQFTPFIAFVGSIKSVLRPPERSHCNEPLPSISGWIELHLKAPARLFCFGLCVDLGL